MSSNYVGIDIGGSSIKVITAKLIGNKVGISTESTLPNKALALNGHLYIDVYTLYDSIKNAIGQLSKDGCKLDSLGIDTYGNGYAIFDRDMSMIGLPFFYKDGRTQGILAKIEQLVPLREIYEQTGVYPTEIRVLMQLYLETITHSARMESGKHLLLLPDIFGYFLTGVRRAERSMVSVANLLSSKTGDWCLDLMEKLSIPTDIFPPIVEGGNKGALLPLFPQVSEELHCKNLQLACVTTHDTESALLAAPMLDDRMIFVSLGSSVICGAKTAEPVVCDNGFNSGFKNIYGAFRSISLCRDFTGLWLLEQCLELWRHEDPHISYSDIMHACELAGENDTYLDVSDASIRFYEGTLIEAIKKYCVCTGQPMVNTVGEISNCILDSIALQVKWTNEQIKHLIGRSIFHGVSFIGGGVRNHLLLQKISDSLGFPLYAGSPYASSIGNVLSQMYAAHELNSIEEIKAVVSNSSDACMITPIGRLDKWEDALGRMENQKQIFKNQRNNEREN